MFKWMGDIFNRFVAGLLVVGASSLIGRLAWVKEVPAYLIILLMLATIGVVLWIINQYSDYKSGRKKNLSKLSEKKIEKIIREWINIPGFSIEKRPKELGIIFHYVVKDESSRNIDIILAEHNPGAIVLTGKMFLPDTRPRNLSESEQRIVAGEISLELARLGIGYDFVGKENKYSEVFLIEPLLLDESLGDYYLRTKITYVVRGMTLINEAYKQSIYKFGLSI